LAEFDSMAKQGYEAAEQAAERLTDGTRLVAVVYHRSDGGAGNRFNVYRVSGRNAKLAYLEINPTMRITLSSIHRDGGIPDLIGDGSRIVAYSATFPATEQQSLIVLRQAEGKLTRLGDYPFALFEDVDGDGKLELVARARPLGSLFAIECESFRSMAQTAFQTRIYSWKGAGLARSSLHFPGYFENHIAELERELSSTDPRRTDDYGGYLGNALSLYFDYDEIGHRRRGWERFVSLFPVRSFDPPRVKSCMKQMEGTMRRALRIPDDW
jgi:hypothetical protein